MQIDGHDIGVVSWSLQANGLRAMTRQVASLGLQHLHLALAPILELDSERQIHELRQISESGLIVTSGMIAFEGENYSSIESVRRSGGFVPNDEWPTRRDLTTKATQLASSFGVKRISTHVGFVADPGTAEYVIMVHRVTEICRMMADEGCELLLETGQDSPENVVQFIADVEAKNIGVNFDPGNLILYGTGDPIRAICTLGRNIKQVHLKDAISSDQRGKTWGKEVVFGTGEVNTTALLRALKNIEGNIPLIFERESGDQVCKDIAAGIRALRAAALSFTSASVVPYRTE